jgi:hypothetical protein
VTVHIPGRRSWLTCACRWDDPEQDKLIRPEANRLNPTDWEETYFKQKKRHCSLEMLMSQKVKERLWDCSRLQDLMTKCNTYSWTWFCTEGKKCYKNKLLDRWKNLHKTVDLRKEYVSVKVTEISNCTLIRYKNNLVLRKNTRNIGKGLWSIQFTFKHIHMLCKSICIHVHMYCTHTYT